MSKDVMAIPLHGMMVARTAYNDGVYVMQPASEYEGYIDPAVALYLTREDIEQLYEMVRSLSDE